MSPDYNAIAEEYKRSKLAPWRTYLERYSLLKLLGEVRGKSVPDLACGEGFYSRLIRERVAGQVVGVDLSSGMIGLAIAVEKELPLSIEWLGLKLSPEWDGSMDYWNDFLDDPPVIFLQCRK